MKPALVIFLLFSSVITYSNDGIKECEETRDSTIKLCKRGFDRCLAHNPESEICEEIYFNCTTRAHEDYNYCIEKL